MRFFKSISAMVPLRRSIAVIAFALLPGLAAAQACPDINAPAAATLTYTGQQLAQAQIMPMIAGGNINIANCPTLQQGAYGHVVAGPDYELHLSGVAPGSNLSMRVQGTCDTLILANSYTGEWGFNDDSPTTGTVDPELVITAADGVYDIWIGTYDTATCEASFSLQLLPPGVTSSTPTGTTGMPPVTPAATCPNPDLPAAMPLVMAAQDLVTQQRQDFVAGGHLDLMNCALNGVQGFGYVAEVPDYELTLTGTAPGAMLNLTVESGQCDVVLLVRDPSGAWQYNDDAAGTNSGLSLPAVDGAYDIWGGTYGTDLCQGQVTAQVIGLNPTVTPPSNTGKPSPTGTTTTPTPTPTPIPAGNAAADPGSLFGFRSQVGQVLSFTVTGSTSGSVWGSGPYTDDSTLAAAAVHAGVLAPGQTGTVNVRIDGPQTGFSASSANGINAAQFGSWGGSFSIVP